MNITSKKVFFNTDDDLKKISEKMINIAISGGVSQAHSEVSENQGLSINVRMGEIETVENTREKNASITVYNGLRKGTANTSTFSDEELSQTVIKAIEIAKYTAEDEFSGLPEKKDIEFKPKYLPLFFPWKISTEEAMEIALEAENSAFKVSKKIRNPDGSSVAISHSNFYSTNTQGFQGGYAQSQHSISVAPIAVQKDEMQRDFWYSSNRDFKKLSNPFDIGKYAAERALSRLGSKKIKTCNVPVLFDAPIGIGLLGSLVQAISGSALYKNLTFLPNSLNKLILSNHINIVEDPFLHGAVGSAPFDAEGVKVKQREVAKNGFLKGYFLSSYTAKRLKMSTTGNAGGSHNLRMFSTKSSGKDNLNIMIKKLHKGLFITELMGQGVNSLTGDYSRGASGFWVQNGIIQYPVNEVTVAGNLKDMLKNIVAIGDDEYTRGTKTCGSILIDSMTIGGK